MTHSALIFHMTQGKMTGQSPTTRSLNSSELPKHRAYTMRFRESWSTQMFWIELTISPCLSKIPIYSLYLHDLIFSNWPVFHLNVSHNKIAPTHPNYYVTCIWLTSGKMNALELLQLLVDLQNFDHCLTASRLAATLKGKA